MSGVPPKKKPRNRKKSGGGSKGGDAPPQPPQQQKQQQTQQQMQVVPPAPPAAFQKGGAAIQQVVASTVTERKKDFITTDRFADLPISAESKRGIAEVLGYEFMTTVQAQTLPHILKGLDCLAKAKTGTGKTLGFLIPAVKLLRDCPNQNAIFSLILSPTRELAAQIAAEGEMLTRYERMKIVCVIGGTNINSDRKRLQGKVDLLIATPGRLIDHLENTPQFHERCQAIRILTMDEADQLLEMGFKPEIEKIISYMPKSRQTLLFSATVSPAVRQIADKALRKGYASVDTVGEEAEQTHKHVRQDLAVLPLDQHVAALAAILATFTREPFYKIMVFFTTARVTGFMSEVFNSMGVDVLEIHSRKSQSQRTKTSDIFRGPGNKIMFSSDVSARGMDYPDVTHVIQVGITEREQYIHRLGRTARAGKSGQGLLLLADFEERQMMFDLKDMKFNRITATEMQLPAFLDLTNDALAKVMRNTELKKSAEQAYGAWLGFYNGNKKKCGWNNADLVQTANFFATTLGLTEQPALEKKTIGKMGLKGVPGLRIAEFDPNAGGGRGGGGGGGGRGGGGGGGRGGAGGGRGGGGGGRGGGGGGARGRW
jgi:ATP-dependent RNA helicase MSS116